MCSGETLPGPGSGAHCSRGLPDRGAFLVAVAAAVRCHRACRRIRRACAVARQAGARSGRSWPGPWLLAAVSRVTARPPGLAGLELRSSRRRARVGSGGAYAVSWLVAVP